MRRISPPLLPKSPLLLSAQGRWHWPRIAAAFLHWGKVNLKSLQGFHPPLSNFVKGEDFTSYKLWGLLFLNRKSYKILNSYSVLKWGTYIKWLYLFRPRSVPSGILYPNWPLVNTKGGVSMHCKFPTICSYPNFLASTFGSGFPKPDVIYLVSSP